MKHISMLLFCFCLFLTANAQNEEGVPFNGLLKDLQDNPIKKARVYISDPDNYVLTDKQGRFGLTDVQDTDTLKIKIKKRLYYIPVDSRKSLSIRLANETSYYAEENQQLIDYGYGYVKQRESTGYSNHITGEKLRKTGSSSILGALQGMVPGLNISGSSGSESVNMFGNKSFYSSSEPLFVVDGMVVNSIDHLSVYDVDYIEILKDAAIYGSRGANGAIVIHLLRGEAAE